MTATDIIHHICAERGINSVNCDPADLVLFKDLDTQKTEVWSLTVTDAPDEHFANMNKMYGNKRSYRFKFPVSDLNYGTQLCTELCNNLGLAKTSISFSSHPSSGESLYLCIHIHSEFAFTARKNNRARPVLQTLKLCFF